MSDKSSVAHAQQRNVHPDPSFLRNQLKRALIISCEKVLNKISLSQYVLIKAFNIDTS